MGCPSMGWNAIGIWEETSAFSGLTALAPEFAASVGVLDKRFQQRSLRPEEKEIIHKTNPNMPNNVANISRLDHQTPWHLHHWTPFHTLCSLLSESGLEAG